MKRFVGLSLIILAGNLANAAFIEQAGALKSVSMGRSGAAYSEGIEALVTNPAGLAFTYTNQFSFEYHKPFYGLVSAGNVPGYYPVDITEGFAGMVFPTAGSGVFGLSWSNLSSRPIYAENTFTAAWAAKGDEGICYGFAIKYMSLSYGADSYTAALFSRYGSGTSGITFDAGLDYDFSENLRLALSARNLYPFNTAIVGRETIPAEINLGGLYCVSRRSWGKVNIAAQINGRSGVPASSLGVEALSEKGIAVRGGVNSSEMSFGIGVKFLKESEINTAFTLPYKIAGGVVSYRAGVVIK